MVINENLNLKEAAYLLGYAAETLRILTELGVGPPVAGKKGSKRRYLRQAVIEFQKRLPLTPNSLLPLWAKEISFRPHDDGTWWPRRSYLDAIVIGADRYFDGSGCPYDHRAAKFTKTRV